MYKFSNRSKRQLATVDIRLQNLFNAVIKEYDVTILEGIRNIAKQKLYFDTGKSKTMNSYHLKGLAVDVAPYPIDWDNINRFMELSIIVKRIAKEQGLNITWGGDWKWKDYPHYQINNS